MLPLALANSWFEPVQTKQMFQGSLAFFFCLFSSFIFFLVSSTMALGWGLRPFMAVLTAPQGKLYLCISTEEEKKFHFPKIPPTSSCLPVPLTTAVYAVNWNGVCFILNNLVIDWGGGQQDSRVIYIPVHGAVISRRLSTASPRLPPKNYTPLYVHVCIYL